MSITFQEPASFRDRTAQVFYRDGEVHRRLDDEALSHWRCLEQTKFFRRFTDEKKLIATEEIQPGTLLHEKIPFVSYPYEWSFSMLQDAALLHLELMLAALEEDMILKDSSSYNVQWCGSHPVFIDIPSFVSHPSNQPWIGYRQFCQLFLFPLMLRAYRGIPFQPWLRGRLDGITVKECRSLMSLRDWFRGGVFRHVILHAMLTSNRPSTKIRREFKSLGFHKALIEANVRGLQRIIRRMRPAKSSTWSKYEQTWTYSETEANEKQTFVEECLDSRKWSTIWDLGCNTGRFTRLAAQRAKAVLAFDSDEVCVDALYREKITNVLPLVMNLADASPSQGWNGRERKSIGERGQADLTLCLALIHHLAIGARLPIEEVMSWLANHTRHLILEVPTTQDPMVQSLMQAHGDSSSIYSLERCEEALHMSFTILRRHSLESGSRVLYFVEKK